MKKFLLSAVAVLAAGTMMAQEDITPANYYFNNAEKFVMDKTTMWTGANLPADAWVSAGAEAKWDNGYICASGGAVWDAANNTLAGNGKCVAANLNLVDLGGTVGKVMCFSSYQSNVNSILKEKTGFDYNIPVNTTGNPFFNLYFFTHPTNNINRDNGNMRVKIVYHVVPNTYQTTDAVGKVYVMDNQNNVAPIGDNAATAAIKKGECCVYDEDMEEYVYDPTRWVEYTFDTNIAANDGDTKFIPARVKMEFPGFWTAVAADQSYTLFIKEVSITALPGVKEAANAIGERNRNFVKYEMGEPAGGAGIGSLIADKAATLSVNGNTVSFSAPATVYNMAGAQVAKGTEATLNAGVYVARMGAKAVKFVVK